MPESSDDEPKALQQDVQRLLGRCLLRLQQYERLIKVIVAHGELSGPVKDLEAIREARVADTARKTLGTLVGDFRGSYLISGEPDSSPETTDDVPDDVSTVSFRVQLSFPDEEFAQTISDLKELVQLRNNLVHHFIDEHDLWGADGCRSAQEALTAAYDRIDQHYGRLRDWAEDLDQARQKMAEYVQSDEFRNKVIKGN